MDKLDNVLEQQKIAIGLIVGNEGKISDISAFVIKNLHAGNESIYQKLKEMLGFDNTDKIDKDLINAYVKFKSKSEDIRPEVLLHKEITVPVGMLNNYNSLVKMLVGMKPYAVKAFNSIVEYDAVVSKSISNSDYREAFLKTDGNFVALISSIKQVEALRHEELDGEETSMLVMDAFSSLSSIGEVVEEITKNKLPLDYEVLNDITNNIADKTDLLHDALIDTPSSEEYLKSLSTITNVTANAVSLLTGIVYTIEITKRALTKALKEMAN